MTTQLSVRHVSADDTLAKPLLADLEREYDGRYGDFFGERASTELNRYPASDFAPPHGAFLVILEDGEPVAGGAFKRFDDRTAELKRVGRTPTIAAAASVDGSSPNSRPSHGTAGTRP